MTLSDRYDETSRVSNGAERLVETGLNTLGNILGPYVGLVLLPISLVALIANEGRGASDAVPEMFKQAVVIDSEKYNPSTNGKLVFLTGNLTGAKELQDEFGVGTKGLSLGRNFYIYRWMEHRQQNDSTANRNDLQPMTFTYDKAWRKEPISSVGFKHRQQHENNSPVRISVTERSTTPAVGLYKLPSDQLRIFSAPVDLKLDPKLQLLTGGDTGLCKLDGQVFFGPSKNPDRKVTVTETSVFIGHDPTNPKVDDVKLVYDYRPDGSQVSVLGKQNDKSIEPFAAPDGRMILKLTAGEQTLDSMMDELKDDQSIIVSFMRIVSIVFIFISYGGLNRWIIRFLSSVPLVAMLSERGFNLLAIALTLITSLIGMGLGKVFVRPTEGVLQIALGVGIVALSYLRRPSQ